MQANPVTTRALERFFDALRRCDKAALRDCCSPGLRFDDPLISITGRDDRLDWCTLLWTPCDGDGQRIWHLELDDVHTRGPLGTARWNLRYRYTPTGRLIELAVTSQFTFDPDGSITAQRDSFDFWRWSRQAHGLLGLLLGWTPLLWDQARDQARVSLEDHQRRWAA